MPVIYNKVLDGYCGWMAQHHWIRVISFFCTHTQIWKLYNRSKLIYFFIHTHRSVSCTIDQHWYISSHRHTEIWKLYDRSKLIYFLTHKHRVGLWANGKPEIWKPYHQNWYISSYGNLDFSDHLQTSSNEGKSTAEQVRKTWLEIMIILLHKFSA